MSYFRKTKDALLEVIDAVLDDRIVRAIEDWQDDESSPQGTLSYQEHLDLQALEEEKARLAAFLAKRYESTAAPGTEDTGAEDPSAEDPGAVDPETIDSRVARTLRSYASGIEMHFDEADLPNPAFIFGHMEQMSDLGYLLEDTAEEAGRQGWGTEEMPAAFPTIKSFLEYQHKLCHQWIFHLSVCENCFGGRRSEPLFPPVDAEEVMDRAASHSVGSKSFGSTSSGRGSSGSRSFGGRPGTGRQGGGQWEDPSPEVHVAESGIFQGDVFGGAFVGDEVSEEEYRTLIQPQVGEGVGIENIHVEDTEISPSMLTSADLGGLPEPVRQVLTGGGSPISRMLEELAEAGESYYIRLRLQQDTRDLASFVSSEQDIGPTGLAKVAEQIGPGLADHIADHVTPKFQARARLQTVIIEVETDEQITHLVLESNPGS